MATATLRDAIEKSHDVAANSVADVQAHADDLKGDLSGYKDEIMSTVGNMYDSGRKSARKLARSAGDLYDTARDRTMDTVRSATRSAKSHPVTTVAIAAGLGLLFGALLMWRRR